MSGYIINGTNLENAWCHITDLAMSLVEPEGLGTFTRAAGVDGGGFVAKNFPPFEFPIPLSILCCDDAGVEAATVTERIDQFFANRQTLIDLVRDPDAPLDVYRVLGSTWAGAYCELARPLEWAMVGPHSARVVLTLRNLTGYWAPSAGYS